MTRSFKGMIALSVIAMCALTILAPAKDFNSGGLTTPVNAYSVSWSFALEIHLIDGTYELFRHYHALPSALDAQGREVAGVRGVLTSMLRMISDGATHIGVA